MKKKNNSVPQHTWNLLLTPLTPLLEKNTEVTYVEPRQPCLLGCKDKFVKRRTEPPTRQNTAIHLKAIKQISIVR